MAARDYPNKGHVLLAWENDMYFRTDYYFTNGFQADFYHEKLEHSPLNWLLIPIQKPAGSNNHYGLQLRQEIHTPKDLSADSVSYGDHPYSSTLTLSQEKIVNLPQSGIRIRSGLRIGVLGPAALGNRTQEAAHSVSNPSRPPQGWDYQLTNDFIINYDLRVEKSIIHNQSTMLGWLGQGRFGTLHTDMESGLWFRLDARKGFFQRLGPSGGRGLNSILHLSASASYVFYNATLQGGVFNRTSPYIISSDKLIRWLGNIDLSITFELFQHQLECYAHFSTMEFKTSSPHTWMGIAYRYWF